MNFNKYIDKAIVTVSTGYNSAATSIDLISNDGNKLSDIFSYDLVWWNYTDYNDPTDDPDKEIITITDKSNDTLTITRARQGTIASNKNISGKTYKLAQLLNQNDWNNSIKYYGEADRYSYQFNDFLTDGEYVIETTGSGNSSAFLPSEPKNPGVLRLTSGGSGSSAIKLDLGGKSFVLTDLTAEFTFYFRPSSFVNAKIFVGLFDENAPSSSEKTNGLYFKISNDSTYFQVLSRNNGSTLSTLTTATVVSSRFYKLQFKILYNYAEVYINDSYQGQVSTLTANNIGPQFIIADSSSSGIGDIDAFEYVTKLSR